MFKADRIAILAEGKLGVLTAKTAACMVRYQPERVLCIIDSTNTGRSVGEVLGFGGDIPVVGSLGEALFLEPDALLIGTSPRGGALPKTWRKTVLGAIAGGLNIISGLHTLLAQDPEIGRAADRANVLVWDIRKPVFPTAVSRGTLREKSGRVLLTVGSDCRTGKMTVAYELARHLSALGRKAVFVPTGQTGILLAGWGVAIDRVPGDFMARATEDLVLEGLAKAPLAVVEGQGSLVHPGYSGVALAMLHGSCADGLILCHDPSRKEIDGYRLAIPSLPDLIRVYEGAAAPVFASQVVAIALNTFALSEREAEEAVRRAADETALFATDIVRWGPGGLAERLGRFL